MYFSQSNIQQSRINLFIEEALARLGRALEHADL